MFHISTIYNPYLAFSHQRLLQSQEDMAPNKYLIHLKAILADADLLTKVKDLGNVSKTDLATACGYVSKKKDGSERVNFTNYYFALLEAKGINVGDGTTGVGKGER